MARANNMITIRERERDAQSSMGCEHYREREFNSYWLEVAEHPSLVSTKLDHWEGNVQSP